MSMPAINSVWKRGELSALAHLSGVSESHLSHIISRKTSVSGKNALKLAEACEKLNLDISLEDWLQSKKTKNEYFGRSNNETKGN